MTEFEQIQQAEQLARSGDKKAADSAYRVLWGEAKHQGVKLDAGLALLALLNQVDNHSELLLLARDVESLAANLNQRSAVAYAQGFRAMCILEELPTLYHQQKCITLPPGWFGFATESEYKEHEMITNEVNRIQLEAEGLFKQAIENAEAVKDQSVIAHIRLFEAKGNAVVISSFDFTHARTILLQRFLEVFGFGRFLLFTREERGARRRLHRTMYGAYKDAIKAHMEANDEIGAGYVYYAIALERKTQFQFIRARLILRKAEKIALKYEDKALVSQIKTLKEHIALKNKDIPKDDIMHLS